MIKKLAKELKYKLAIDKKLRDLLKEPNENFIRFLIKECGFNESDELIEDIKPIINLLSPICSFTSSIFAINNYTIKK